MAPLPNATKTIGILKQKEICPTGLIQANNSLMTSPATTVGRSALPLCM
jgi:hypothetical protein